MNVTQAILTAMDFNAAKEALMKEFSCKDIRRVPLAMADDDRYYVCNEFGQVFFLKQFSDGVFVTRLKPMASKTRKTYLIYKMSVGRGVQKAFPAANVVWNTFLGEWHEGINVVTRDGNAENIAVGNLSCEGSIIGKFTAQDFSGEIYGRHFNDYVNYATRLWYTADEEDIKDIVSNSFLEVVHKADNGEHLRLLWKMAVKHRLFDYVNKMDKHVCFDEEMMEPTWCAYPEVDFSGMLDRKSEAEVVRMAQHGYSLGDICDISGEKMGTVASKMTRAVQTIRFKIGL